MNTNDRAYLAHHGILGMKWGVRRFQNKDGSLTSAGRIRYSDESSGSYESLNTKRLKSSVKKNQEWIDALNDGSAKEGLKAQQKKLQAELKTSQEKDSTKTGMSSSTQKKIAAAALAAGAITVAAIYASKHPEQVNKVVNSAKDIAVNKLGGSVKKGASYVADFAKNATSALKQGYSEGIDDRKMKETNTSPKTSKETGLAVNQAKYQRNARSIGNAVGQVKETISYAVKNAPKKAMEGAAEGLAEAPKKVAKGLVEGAAITACTKLLNDALGKANVENYRKAYNAYNKKNKIGEVNTKKKDDEDDED